MEPAVVSIVGKGRSGSTLLDRILGSLPGWFSVGELWHRVGYGGLGDLECGCGVRARDCVVWSQVLRRLSERYGEAEIARLDELETSVHRWNAPHRLFVDGRDRRALVEYAEAVYVAVSEVTGAEVIVDSSKWPLHPSARGLVRGTTQNVHLVRDPRGVASSWTKSSGGKESRSSLPRHSVWHSSLSWLARNASVHLFVRPAPILVRYEAFAAQPRQEMERLLRALHGPSVGDLFLDAHTVRVGDNHILKGNPGKYSDGSVTIRADEDWKRSLSRARALIVWGMCGLLARRYGYRWRGGGPPPHPGRPD